MDVMRTFRSSRPDAPPAFFATEAAGLAWLAEPGAIPVVEVLDVAEDGLTLEHLSALVTGSTADPRTEGDAA